MGLDLGLEQAGWTCAFANEHDPTACRTIRSNKPGLNLLEADVRSLSASDMKGFGQLDAVVGGPPCQAFSTAGKRLGLNDERGNVFLHFIELACRLQPRVIIVENVRGLLSAPLHHRPHCLRGDGHPSLRDDEKPGGALGHIIGHLRRYGYSPTCQLLDAKDYGVPQKRLRLLVMALRDGQAMQLRPLARPAVTFRQAVKGLSEPAEYVQLRSQQVTYLKRIGPGQNWRSLPPDLQRQALGRAYFSSGGRTGFLRRLAWDEPSPTLLTSPIMPATLLAHPEEDRPLSVEEYARIQTFPDEWTFAGTTTQKYRQIGNAVPVLLGRAIGAQVKTYLQNQTTG